MAQKNREFRIYQDDDSGRFYVEHRSTHWLWKWFEREWCFLRSYPDLKSAEEAIERLKQVPVKKIIKVYE